MKNVDKVSSELSSFSKKNTFTKIENVCKRTFFYKTYLHSKREQNICTVKALCARLQHEAAPSSSYAVGNRLTTKEKTESYVNTHKW